MCALRKPGDATKDRCVADTTPLCRRHNAPSTTSKGHFKNAKAESPLPQDALLASGPKGAVAIVDVDYPTAIAFLRREAITLSPDAPRGYVAVSFLGHPLGFAKNIGQRANNLYPKEWAIRSTYVPDAYSPVIMSVDKDV